MKTQELIEQLIRVLPIYTDVFNSSASIASIIVSGSDAIVTTTAAHGIDNGKGVNVQGVETPVNISSLTQVDGVATCVTVEPHDLTLNPREGDEFIPSVQITGATPSGYNGIFQVTSVKNRTTFTFNVSDALSSPASGSMFAFDGKDRGFNGYQAAVTVNTATEFQYPLTNIPPADGFGSEMRAAFNFRISGATNTERIIDAYTEQEQNDSWAFVILDDASMSRNRRIEEDSTYTYADGQDYRQTLIQPFTVYVVEPTTEVISGRPARDKMQDLLLPIFKSFLRFKTAEPFAAEQVYGITCIGHGFFSYNPAYYIHQFNFENVVEITYDDTTDPAFNVAFRDINGTIEKSDASPDTESLEFGVNLDENAN